MDKCERDSAHERAVRMRGRVLSDLDWTPAVAETIDLFLRDAVESNRPDAWWDLSDLLDDIAAVYDGEGDIDYGGES